MTDTDAFHNSKISILVSVLLLLQASDFLAFRFWDYFLNQQLFFGLVGGNLLTLWLGSILAIVILILYLKKIIGWEIFLLLPALASNLLDRLIYGGVVDYLAILNYPKFNIADVLIVIGALIFTIRWFRTYLRT